jgi:hypothetical protein
MDQVSLELPDYLRTSYSILTSKSVRFSKKPLKTQLRQGISIEAPDFFKVPKTTIISSVERKEILDSRGDRFLSDLKRNQVTPSKLFNYSDLQLGNYDYDSLSFIARIGLKEDKNPKLRRTGGFLKKYKEDLAKGFGVARGEFAVESLNPKVTRPHPGQAKNLEDLLRKTSKSRFLSTKSRTPSHKPLTSPSNNSVFSGVTHLIKKEKKEIMINPIEDLDSFEARLPKSSLAEKRKIYSISRLL